MPGRRVQHGSVAPRTRTLRRAFCGAALLIPLVFSPVVSVAQQPTAPTLDAVVSFALRHNPDLATARLHVDSARAEQRIAASYADPVATAAPGLPSQYAIDVPIDIGPQRTYRTRAAAQGHAAAVLDATEVTREVVFATRQAFLDLLLADSLASVARYQRDIFQQLLVADSVRLRSGDIPERDVARSELELARAEARRQRADAVVRSARIALQFIMGVREPDTGFTIAGSMQYRPVRIARDTLLALATQRRPDLAAAAERVQQSATLRSLARAQLFPMPTANLVYQPAQPFASGQHYALAVGVQVPLWNWYGGERERARTSADIAALAQHRTQLQVAADVTTAVDAFDAAQVLAAAYETGLLTKATADLDATRYAYQTGATSLVDLLSSINNYIAIQTEYFTAEHDYWVAAYALNRAVGDDMVTGP